MKKLFLIAGLFFASFSAYAADVESSYTSIDANDCTTLTADRMGSVQRCEFFADIEVNAVEGDLRQSLTLKRGGNEYPLDFWQTVSPAFSTLGAKVEWRHLAGNANKPFAFITRLNASENPEGPEQTTSYLVVGKITPDIICVVGKVSPQVEQNQRAREMADQSAIMPCIGDVSIDEPESSYTSIEEKDCQTIEAENLGSLQNCPSFADIKVQALEGDLRQSLTLIRGDVEYPLELWRTVSMAYSALGPKIEWRYRKGKPGQPYSLITRLNVAEDPENLEKRISYLVVSKITPETICVIGKVPPQAKQNQKARNMADQAASMPCIGDNVTSSDNLDIGVMVGDEYADYCSFMTSEDSQAFVFDDRSTWKFVFTGSHDGQSARMMINGDVVNLTAVAATSHGDTAIEKYAAVDKGLEVSVAKEKGGGGFEHTNYKGSIMIIQGDQQKEITFVGDCGV